VDRYLGRHHQFTEVGPLDYNLIEYFDSPVAV